MLCSNGSRKVNNEGADTMNIITTENNGEHTARVVKGDLVVFVTAEYLTKAMALADAKCWVAFHGETMTAEMVWVPIGGGEEIELPYGDVTRIALDYQTVRDLARSGEQFASKRALRPLLNWARDTHGLTSRDMREIARWWWTVDAKDRVARGRQAVKAHQAQNAR